MKNKLIIAIGLIALVFVSIVFNQEDRVGTNKIGFIIPLTGPVAPIAEGLRNTINFTGIQNIEVLVEDDACEGKQALSAYQKLKNEGVKIFYVACSAGIFSIEPLAKENGDIIVTSYAFDLDIRNTGDHVIRFIPDALDVFDSMNKYFEQNNSKTFSLLYEQGTYQSLADKIVEKLGTKLLSNESYGSDATDIRTQVTKVLSTKPDELIFLPIGDLLAKNAFIQMQNMNNKTPIIGEFNLCSYPFKASDFGISSYCWEGNLDNAKAQEFLRGYKVKFGMENQYPFFDQVTYDIIKITDTLVGEYGTINEDTIFKIKDDMLDGVDGEISSYEFNESGKLKNGVDFLVGKTR